MEIINLNNHYSVVNNYLAELRDCDYQRNPDDGIRDKQETRLQGK